MWLQAAGLGLSMLQGFGSGKAAANAQRVQSANQYQQNLIQGEREYLQIQQAMAGQGRANSAIAQADLQSLINTNFTAGLMNLQRAQQKRESAAGMQRLGETKLQALAGAATSSAASGTIGASVDAVASDIKLKVGEARIDMWEQNEMNTLTLDTQIHNLYRGFITSQQNIDTSIPDIPGMPPQYGAMPVSAGAAALGAGINYAGNLISQNMNLGLGGGGFNVGSGFNLGGFGGAITNPTFSAKL